MHAAKGRNEDGASNGRREGSGAGNPGPINMTASVSPPPAVNAGTPQAAADAGREGASGPGVDRVPPSRVGSHPGSPPSAAAAGRSDEDAGRGRSRERAVEESGSGGAPEPPSQLPSARPVATFVGDLRVAELRLRKAVSEGKDVVWWTAKVADLKKAVVGKL